jgi:hypothetical protein
MGWDEIDCCYGQSDLVQYLSSGFHDGPRLSGPYHRLDTLVHIRNYISAACTTTPLRLLVRRMFSVGYPRIIASQRVSDEYRGQQPYKSTSIASYNSLPRLWQSVWACPYWSRNRGSRGRAERCCLRINLHSIYYPFLLSRCIF